MAQQAVDPKLCGAKLGNADADALPSNEKQPSLGVKKTPLRDLPNQNNIVPCKSTGEPIIQKERGAAAEIIKVSGIKQASTYTMSSPQHHPPCSNGASGQLVYVRRKSDEVVKNCTDEISSDKADSAQQVKPASQEEADPPLNELKVPRFSAFSPSSTTSVISSPSGNPSVPTPIKPANGTVTEESCGRPVSADQRQLKLNWEDRYLQLQMYLKKLDQSSQEDYVHSLRNLSSIELSKHAVELEKRAIQLSLEEGKELERVKSLNVLGKSMKSSSSPAAVQRHLPPK